MHSLGKGRKSAAPEVEGAHRILLRCKSSVDHTVAVDHTLRLHQDIGAGEVDQSRLKRRHQLCLLAYLGGPLRCV